MQKIVVAVTGASGSIYARQLLQKLQQLSTQVSELSVVMSTNAATVWETELGDKGYDETVSYTHLTLPTICSV